jgi:DNA polymerase family A
MFPFRELWCVDFEFRGDPGERPWVVCMVAQELIGGRRIQMWRNELLELRRAPFDTGPDAALIAYYASAELGCFLELGWPLPVNVIDLFAEHRVETNGQKLPCGNNFLGALAIRGLAHIGVGEKDAMRQLIIGQRQWTETEQRAILEYCASDVAGLVALLPVMAPTIDLPRAKLRARYMAAAARMERTGIPIDAPLHQRLVANWETIKEHLIAEVDRSYGVFEKGSFKQANFGAYLQAHRIPWPRLPSGTLALDDTTFDEQARSHPQLRPLYELRSTLSRLRLSDIPVGADDRARCLLSAFQAVTGRNQPSSSKFVFGPARWMRGLVREREGRAVSYVDWSTQEIAIAAGLSGDERMAEDYTSGDVYLAFAKANHLVPDDATKETHADFREVCKAIVLGVNYGMGPETMAFKAGISIGEARELQRLHKATYKTFWKWIDDTVTTALFTGKMQAVFGWRRHVARNSNPRSLMNFPMQANGAEMMRLAAIAATEAGIEVCCPVHDAFLISAPINRVEDDVAAMRELMSKAGRAVTGGLDVRTDVKIVRWPDRYMDKRGEGMWRTVMTLLESLGTPGPGSHQREPGLLTGDTVDPDLLTSENVVQPLGVNLLSSENPVLFSSYNIDT